MSTGNGQIKAAYGHANVNIVNESAYDLIVNRIDTTRDRIGKITIIDTARIVDGPANDEARIVSITPTGPRTAPIIPRSLTSPRPIPGNQSQ